jgi:hypothetical protein
LMGRADVVFWATRNLTRVALTRKGSLREKTEMKRIEFGMKTQPNALLW